MCLATGASCPAELFNRGMSWDDLLLWQAHYEAQPWGEMRADARQFVLIDWLTESWRDKKSHRKLPDICWPYFPEQQAAAVNDGRKMLEHLTALKDRFNHGR